MPAIEVQDLQKTFQTKRKTAGMRGSVRLLFKREYRIHVTHERIPVFSSG